MDDLLEEIASLGIEIVEEPAKGEKRADETEKEEETIPAGLALDDPVLPYWAPALAVRSPARLRACHE